MKTRIKIETIVLIAVLLSTGIISTMGNRTINDSHGKRYQCIENSNGNYWNATGTNIQAAIDNIGITGPIYGGYGGPRATVTLPGNTTITISSTIIVKDYITLDMNGCVIKPSGDFDVILLHKGARICNGIINVSGVGTYNHAAIRFLATDNIGSGQMDYIDNMHLISASQRGKAIYLNTSGTADGNIAFVFVNRITIEKFQYGIYLNHSATAGDNYINGNVFSNIYMNAVKYCIKLYEFKAEVTENMFENIICNCSSATEYIIYDGGSVTQYDNIQALNWDNNSGTRDSYTLETGNMEYLCFYGGGNDLSLPTWNLNSNAYTILNYGNSSLWLGRITQYNP